MMNDLLELLNDVVAGYDEGDTEVAHGDEDAFLLTLVREAASGRDVTVAAAYYLAWVENEGKDRIRWYA